MAQQSRYPEDDPYGAAQLAFEQLRSVMPKETAAAKIRPFNWLEKLLVPPGEVASTSPFNTIRINTVRKPTSNDDDFRNMDFAREVMGHELTHVGQNVKEGGVMNRIFNAYRELSKPYFQRPAEQEAYASAQRFKPLGDIQLPNDDLSREMVKRAK